MNKWALLKIVKSAVCMCAFPVLVVAQERGLEDYVGSAICASCHGEAAQQWSGSHHALAWTEATADNIAADFSETEFSHDGMHAHFRIDPDGSYHVEVTEKDGVTSDYTIHSVAGIAPLQQYLIETKPGTLQSFDVVWNVAEQRWFHLYPDQNLPPDDGLHWTGTYKNWNSRCAECHATGFDKNYNPETRSYQSTQVEIGVGCEACHGPGANHVEWAAKLATAQSLPPENYGFSAAFEAVEGTIQQCATCHSRREAQMDGNPKPGTSYHDSYALSRLNPDLYHADGQILDEVYVYGSFLQSKMYAKGVSCTNCHNPHTAERLAEGNALCTQCHSLAGNPDFPTLTQADYDSQAHHFHFSGSEGAQCVSCHMIERTYMGIDGRRDHSFRIPRPDLAATTGGPDACTDCHQDQSPDWAATQIATWYPDPRNRGPHYGQILSRGRMDAGASAGELLTLSANTNQPGIVRATALWLLRQTNDPSVANRAADHLDDPDPLLRSAAVGLQVFADPKDRVTRATALLADPVRSVRIEAAKAMLGAPVARMPQKMTQDLQNAMAEWQSALGTRLDFPETYLVVAGTALTQRNFELAESAFREATILDPQLIDAWIMLIRIAAASRGPEDAGQIVREALGFLPDDLTLLGFASELGVTPAK